MNPQANPENPLMKLGDMIPKATPVYEGFWKNSDVDILLRLDVASEELKVKEEAKPRRKPLQSHLPVDKMKLMNRCRRPPTPTGQRHHLY